MNAIVAERLTKRYGDLEALDNVSFEVPAGIGSQAQFERQPRSRLLRNIGVGRELVADGRADEVRAIGIETVSHQEIDRSKIDEP